ncbi:hypothetical protein [Streptomyces sp. NPDC018031]|uniref:hypothetical protein n=1 Tax=Streptomyces sp. NPDC018031 TaxID=3365033 RepID=UPI0037B5B8C8
MLGAGNADESAPGTHHHHHHRTTTVEKGSFSTARCSCGWFGPARRARSRAREDAAGHECHSGHSADGTANPRSPSA